MPVKLKIMSIILFFQLSLGVHINCAKADVFYKNQQYTLSSNYVGYAADGIDFFTYRFDEYKDKNQKNGLYRNSISKIKYFLLYFVAAVMGIALVLVGVLIYRLYFLSTHRKILHRIKF